MLLVLKNLAVDWGSLYANNAVLRTAVTFAHIAGLVAAGGAALVADRAILTARRRPEHERQSVLASVHSSHSVVLVGLAVVIVSGVLLFGADLDTYLGSRIFWIKMVLLVVLMLNGAVLARAEHRARVRSANSWGTLRWTAIASLTLWCATTLLGTGLLNIG